MDWIQQLYGFHFHYHEPFHNNVRHKIPDYVLLVSNFNSALLLGFKSDFAKLDGERVLINLFEKSCSVRIADVIGAINHLS